MKNVNGTINTNVKQIKNVKAIPILLSIIIVIILGLSVVNISNLNAKEESNLITDEDYERMFKGQLEAEKMAAENTAKKVKEARARKKVEYTQKDLQEDLKLTIEELQKKYPVKWFDDRFNISSACEFAEDAPSPLPDYCEPEIYFLNDFTNQEILSIFVNTESEQRETRIKAKVMCDIKDNGAKSKWYILKDILYRKEVLQRFNCLMATYDSKDSCKSLPDEDYVVEIYFNDVYRAVKIFKDEKMEKNDLSKFSPFFQEKYQEYKLNLNKDKK